MEACFSQLTLDVIGKAVFNYDFDALNTQSPLIQVSAFPSQLYCRLQAINRSVAIPAHPSISCPLPQFFPSLPIGPGSNPPGFTLVQFPCKSVLLFRKNPLRSWIPQLHPASMYLIVAWPACTHTLVCTRALQRVPLCIDANTLVRLDSPVRLAFLPVQNQSRPSPSPLIT